MSASPPDIRMVSPAASAEETAAIAAAVQRFINDHAPTAATAPTAMNPWLRAGLLEATGHNPDFMFGETSH